MFAQQQLVESSWNEVWEELVRTTGAEAKAAGFAMARVAKGESRVAKLKENLKTFTKRAVEKYTKGFCLA